MRNQVGVVAVLRQPRPARDETPGRQIVASHHEAALFQGAGSNVRMSSGQTFWRQATTNGLPLSETTIKHSHQTKQLKAANISSHSPAPHRPVWPARVLEQRDSEHAPPPIPFHHKSRRVREATTKDCPLTLGGTLEVAHITAMRALGRHSASMLKKRPVNLAPKATI